MPHRSIRSAVALCAVAGALPASADAHTGEHASLTWIMEERCVPGDSYHANDPDWADGDELRNLPVSKPRLAGRFRSGAPRTVTVLARSEGRTSALKAAVRRAGRFAVDFDSMPDRFRLRWRADDGVLHASSWSPRLHSGCEDPGPERPPGVPADWVPYHETPCGDDGPPCPPPTWGPPPSWAPPQHRRGA